MDRPQKAASGFHHHQTITTPNTPTMIIGHLRDLLAAATDIMALAYAGRLKKFGA